MSLVLRASSRRHCPGRGHRPGRVIAVAGSALALALVASGIAEAQIRERRGETVIERARPDYAPRNFRSGGLVIAPELRLQEIFNDNVFADPEDQTIDLITVVEPRVRVRSNWSRHRLDGLAFVQRRQFLDNTEESETTFGGEVGGELEITERDDLDANVEFLREEEDRTAPEFEIVEEEEDERTSVTEVIGDFGYDRRFNRVAVGLDTRIDRTAFGAESEDFRENTFYRFASTLAYVPSPSLSLFVRPFYALREFDEETFIDDDGELSDNRDSTLFGGSVGTAFEITDVIFGEVAVGVFREDFDSDEFEDFTSLSTEGAIEWNVTSLTTVVGEIERDSEATQQLGASARVRTTAEVGVEHELLNNVILLGDALYERNQFEGIDLDDDEVELRVGTQYFVNRSLFVTADYRFRNRSSTDESRDFTINTFTLGVVGRF